MRLKSSEFEERVRPHLNILYTFALHMTGHPREADDLLIESLQRAFRSLDSLDEASDIRTFLIKRIATCSIKLTQKPQPEPCLVNAWTCEKELDRRLNTQTDPENAFSNLTDTQVAKAMACLLRKDRAIFLLATAANLSYRNIAETFSITVDRVISRLHRARRVLQATLLESREPSGPAFP